MRSRLQVQRTRTTTYVRPVHPVNFKFALTKFGALDTNPQLLYFYFGVYPRDLAAAHGLMTR